MTDFENLTASLKLLTDQTRIRILAVLEAGEFTVKEITDILNIGQSTLSTQLGQLKESNLVNSRKQGQFVLYRSVPQDHHPVLKGIFESVLNEAKNAEWFERDQRNIEVCFDRRKETSLGFFGSRSLVQAKSPGQTWESLAVGLISSISGKSIVDLGCGTGKLSARFAHSGNLVIGIDNSPEQISAAQSLHEHIDKKNLQYMLSPAEKTPLGDGCADLVLISHTLHHAAEPKLILKEASRLLKKNGRLLILDLLAHSHEWMQEKYGDFWLGFTPSEVVEWLTTAGFREINHAITQADADFPEIEPLIITASKA